MRSAEHVQTMFGAEGLVFGESGWPWPKEFWVEDIFLLDICRLGKVAHVLGHFSFWRCVAYRKWLTP